MDESGGVVSAADEASGAGDGFGVLGAGLAEGELAAAGDEEGSGGDGGQRGALVVVDEVTEALPGADGDGLAVVGVVAGGVLGTRSGDGEFVAAGQTQSRAAVRLVGQEACAVRVVDVVGALAVLGQGLQVLFVVQARDWERVPSSRVVVLPALS